MADVTIAFPRFSLEDKKHFWGFVDKTPGQGPQGECWQWTGRCTRKYGRYINKNLFKNRLPRAHRVAFFLTTGVDPVLQVLHRCDNPPCCNPQHLWLGTHKDNVRDMWVKGRGRSGRSGRPRKRSTQPPKKRCSQRSKLSVIHGATRKPITADPGRYRTISQKQNGVGEQHPNAKLTRVQVLAIRYFHDVLGVDRAVLARQYGVHRASIRDIVWRRSWAHV